MSQHTPGPWEALTYDLGGFHIVQQRAPGGIVALSPRALAPGDAALLASAPALLWALREFVAVENADMDTPEGECSYCHGPQDHKDWEKCPLHQARAALALAREGV